MLNTVIRDTSACVIHIPFAKWHLKITDSKVTSSMARYATDTDTGDPMAVPKCWYLQPQKDR